MIIYIQVDLHMKWMSRPLKNITLIIMKKKGKYNFNLQKSSMIQDIKSNIIRNRITKLSKYLLLKTHPFHQNNQILYLMLYLQIKMCFNQKMNSMMIWKKVFNIVLVVLNMQVLQLDLQLISKIRTIKVLINNHKQIRKVI